MCFANSFCQQWRSTSECSSDPSGSNCELIFSKGQLKCDDTRSETRFRLSAKRTSTFKYLGASVQSTTGDRSVCISGSNAGYMMFRGSVRVLATHSIHQFPLHFPSRASPCAITFQLDSNNIARGGDLPEEEEILPKSRGGSGILTYILGILMFGYTVVLVVLAERAACINGDIFMLIWGAVWLSKLM